MNGQAEILSEVSRGGIRNPVACFHKSEQVSTLKKGTD
jgi:hypothetical protein